MIEISLLDAASNAYARDGAQQLAAVAKRHRVNAEKIGESVAQEFAARQKNRAERCEAREARKSGEVVKGIRSRRGA